MRTSSGVTYLHSDHLHTTTNTTGAQTTSQRYYPFGQTRGSNTVATTYRFTGQRWEDTIKLYYYNARWYHAGLGRFISADTIVPQPGNPQSLNRYSYVGNNPLKYTDPSGRWYYDPGCDCLVHTKEGYNEYPQYLNIPPATSRPIHSVVSYILEEMRTNSSSDSLPTSQIQEYNRLFGEHLSHRRVRKAIEARFNAYNAWADMVDTDRPWDHKSVIKREFGYGQYVGNETYTFDVWSNIHYGYVGRDCGFSEVELLAGAGYAQIKAGTSGWSYWSSWFDDPRDQAAIQVGINLYNKQGLSLTVELLLLELWQSKSVTTFPKWEAFGAP